ncbi:Signal transduction histidine kinase [Carnobacterium iners]|uniref:Signal transduction histidine-protein kinase ArlS n=2 Tax=Carnobacterium iners TaxID=1073423 RepID=A0A1X7NR71_9LACT|nr:Signal transduction histidine kinase [Carnobacterium iners]SMH40516.1 Signal transduction histidine kinase [Carnobacterium iners]
MTYAFSNKNNKKRISLKWKWTIGATLAIFLTYIIFTVAIFIGFRQIMLTEETQDVKEILVGVTNRLNGGSSALSKETVYLNLSGNYTLTTLELGEEFDQRNLVYGQSSNYQDTIFAKMNEEGVFVRVYSPTSRLLFETEPKDSPFKRSAQLLIEPIKMNNKGGIRGVSPIYSRVTQNLIGYVQVTNEMVNYHYMSGKILWAILGIGILALIFSAVLGYLLAVNFLKPIKKITNTMNDIREDTQSTSRIELDEGNDELTHLSTVFNDMLDRMQRYIEQQKDFVEDVSHELRTPVAIMEGHLKLLNRWGKDDPEVLDESLQASLQEIERMKSLVQEMLDLSRAEQVEIHYKNEKTSLKPLILQAIINFKLIYPDFVFNLDDDIRDEIYVSIYRNHLEQILVIILDNAVKYSSERKEIHVSVAADNQNVDIAIQDFGEGMTQEDTEKIFNRFYRVDKARSRYKGGNGLGLAIARELLIGYKGTVYVESVLDYGSIFRIKLPIYQNEIKNS